MLIAGKAAPNAKIEVVAGARVIGRTIAWPDGDFLIILDEPLNSGGYQLALRSTTSDNATRTSLETALVSIPETETGQLLVLIEQPGEASKLVTVPKVASSNSAAEPAEQVKVAASPAPTVLSPAKPYRRSKVAIEAVEIDGRKIFLAGTALSRSKSPWLCRQCPARRDDNYPSRTLLDRSRAQSARWRLYDPCRHARARWP